jgi:maleate isomerase
MLALNELLALLGARSIGFVTPYLDDVQAKIVANYTALGYPCAAERHLNLRDNFSFCEVSEAHIADMTRAVAAGGPDAIAIVCTNMHGAPGWIGWRRSWGCRSSIRSRRWCGSRWRWAGLDPARITGWGRLFGLKPAALG